MDRCNKIQDSIFTLTSMCIGVLCAFIRRNGLFFFFFFGHSQFIFIRFTIFFIKFPDKIDH